MTRPIAGLDLIQRDVPVVASLSGGKDSTAMCLALDEAGIEHRRVYADTGWEHASTYEHLDYLRGVLGPIEVVRLSPLPVWEGEIEERVQEIERLVGVSPSPYVRLVAAKGMFPSRMRRFCTQQFKIRPLVELFDRIGPLVNAVGIRAAESRSRAGMAVTESQRAGSGWSYDGTIWRPVLHWSIGDVAAIHQRHGIRPHPLYLRGCARVGCWPCLHARRADLQLLAQDAARVRAIELLEALAGDMAEARGADRPAMFQAFDRVGQDREAPCIPISEALAWANRPGRGSLDEEEVKESACSLWGVCEHPQPQLALWVAA